MPDNPGVAVAAPSTTERQLYFTRAEKLAVCRRLLLGAAVLNALGVAFLITINVAGSYGANHYLLAEDAFLFTWTRWYNLQTDEGPSVVLYTFRWYMNGLCLLHVNGTDCLYHRVGNAFNTNAFTDAMSSYLDSKNSTLEVPGELTLPRGYRSFFAMGAFILLTVGMLAVLGSWALLFASDRVENGAKAGLWRGAQFTQFLAAILYLAGAVTLTSGCNRAWTELDDRSYSLDLHWYSSGWSAFALAYCAFAAQSVGFVALWVWVRVWKSKDKEVFGYLPDYETSQAAAGSGSGSGDEHDGLPGYTRHDPMGRPPSIGGGPPPGHDSEADESIELTEVSRGAYGGDDGGDQVSREERSRPGDGSSSNAQPAAAAASITVQANTSYFPSGA